MSGGDSRAQSLHSILSQTSTNQRGDGGLDQDWQGNHNSLLMENIHLDCAQFGLFISIDCNSNSNYSSNLFNMEKQFTNQFCPEIAKASFELLY